MADVVLLATADWDHPLWTNKQHVEVALAAEGHRVLYVESLGLRPAQATARDFSRILKRLRRGLRRPRRVRPGIWVWSPLVWPGGSTGLTLMLNRLSLSLGLRIALLSLRFRRPWLWTYNPLTATLLSLRPFARRIYHAVDAVQEQPCMPSFRIEQAERHLCGLMDHVFVTSPQLERQLKPWSRRIRLIPTWPTRPISPRPSPPAGGAAGGPGGDSRSADRFHRSCEQLQARFRIGGGGGPGPPHCSLCLSVQPGKGAADEHPLLRQANIHLLGARPYDQLPAYCSGFSCGWLPRG